MTMLEKIARAIEAALDTDAAHDMPSKERAEIAARAAFEAARDWPKYPDGPRVNITQWGGHGEPGYPGDDAIWHARIDAILNEKTP